LKTGILSVRWRLVIGLVSLATAVVLTLPGGASRLLEGAVAETIWPNSPVAETIWPNSPVAEIIWPNSPLLDQVIQLNTWVPD
jgi:hypothetical protein